MVTWGQFASEAPALAAAGEKLLRHFTLAFVPTFRRDGAPRVHPMTITIYDGGLYVFPVRSTPKADDFERDGRYALHAFPHLPSGTLASYVDDEFTVSGVAFVSTIRIFGTLSPARTTTPSAPKMRSSASISTGPITKLEWTAELSTPAGRNIVTDATL